MVDKLVLKITEGFQQVLSLSDKNCLRYQMNTHTFKHIYECVKQHFLGTTSKDVREAMNLNGGLGLESHCAVHATFP